MRAEGHPQHRRVRKRSDFKRAYAEGRKIVVRPFVLFAIANHGTDSRLGVTATRKLGNAVVRNRAKRMIREAFRRSYAAWPGGQDYVVVARRAMLEMPIEDLMIALLRAARRANEEEAT